MVRNSKFGVRSFVAAANYPTARISNELELLGGEAEVPSAVFLPAVLRLLRTSWLLFTEAHDGDAVGGKAKAHEIVADRRRPALGEGQVVLVGAARVGVAFDHEL